MYPLFLHCPLYYIFLFFFIYIKKNILYNTTIHNKGYKGTNRKKLYPIRIFEVDTIQYFVAKIKGSVYF